ncbi:MAG: efflux RND transporter periplasmic adaptor subunit [Bryobacteraceae bacterium]|jgi:RND family efflux transporter MFP subunit
MKTEVEIQTRPGSGRLLAFFGVLALLVIACIAGGLLPRMARQKGLAASAAEVTQRKPVVIVSAAKTAPAKETIDLPGDFEAMVESPIFARADGFLKSRVVDIGDHVKTGQLMAEIETPELDQQIGQARANLAQSQASLDELKADIELARANQSLAQVTLDRWQHLSDKGVVARQELDQKKADFDVKHAQTQRADATLATARETVLASQANLQRLQEMKGFARVVAPFDGVVTARNVDVGTLINAGNGGASREMFRVARITPLRIFVNVPQTYVSEMHNGQSAELRVEEKPGEIFPARVTNISDSLNADSRAMLVILETPNPGATLFPGAYAQVRFTLAQAKPLLRIPGDALIQSKTGPRVAVVDSGNIVHFRDIAIGQDLGTEIEVLSGLALGELVISNPSDAVVENASVDVRRR